MKCSGNRMWIMALCCILPLLIIIEVFAILPAQASYLAWAPLLLCPLAMWIMMRYMDKEDRKKNPEKMENKNDSTQS